MSLAFSYPDVECDKEKGGNGRKKQMNETGAGSEGGSVVCEAVKNWVAK